VQDLVVRCGRTLDKEQDFIHASVDEFIDEAGARLGTADNSLTGFDELFHGVGSALRQLLLETLDDVLVSRSQPSKLSASQEYCLITAWFRLPSRMRLEQKARPLIA
jgi:hypothetical protein